MDEESNLRNLDSAYISDLDGEGNEGKYHKLSDMPKLETGCNLNCFGIIISSTFPKKNSAKASHQYSISFGIIDPFQSNPASNIPVNIFFNRIEEFELASCLYIGAVIICENVKYNRYKDFPQLVASQEKSGIYIFYPRKDHTSSPCTLYDYYSQHPAYPFKLLPDFWYFYKFGRIAMKLKLAQIVSSLAMKILKLSIWSEEFLRDHSLADTQFPHSSLHKIYHLCHHSYHQAASTVSAAIGTDNASYHVVKNYPLLLPKALSGDLPSASAAMMSVTELKLDIVAMVIAVLTSSSEGQGTTRLLLWDGSAQGMFHVQQVMTTAATAATTGGAATAAGGGDGGSNYDRVIQSLLTATRYLPAVADDNNNNNISNNNSNSNNNQLLLSLLLPPPPSSSLSATAVAPTAAASFSANSTISTAITMVGNNSPVPAGYLLGQAIILDTYQDTPSAAAAGVAAGAATVNSYEYFLQRFPVGSFLRCRNIILPAQRPLADLPLQATIATVSNAATPTTMMKVPMVMMRYDTHLNLLSPATKDVMMLMKDYYQRLFALQEARQLAALAATAAATTALTVATAVTVATAAIPANPPPPLTIAAPLKLFNQQGHPFTRLALILHHPAPAKFACYGQIVSWYPKDIRRFVQPTCTTGTAVDDEEQQQQYQYHFVIRISDPSFVTDLLVTGKDAEIFLGGISPLAFAKNEHQELQRIADGLQACRDQGIYLEWYVKSYTVKLSQQQLQQGGSGSSSSSSSGTGKNVKKSHGNKVNMQKAAIFPFLTSSIKQAKRLIVYNTIAPF